MNWMAKRNTMRTHLSLLALLLAAGVLMRTPAAPQKPKQKKTAILSGVVFRGDRQQPVADALIVLSTVKVGRDEDEKIRVEARSDAAGGYRFAEVPGGNYRVTIRTSYDSRNQVPCQLLAARTSDEHSSVVVLEEDGKFIEQVLITHLPIKAGKEIVRDFDLQCRSVFSRDEVKR